MGLFGFLLGALLSPDDDSFDRTMGDFFMADAVGLFDDPDDKDEDYEDDDEWDDEHEEWD